MMMNTTVEKTVFISDEQLSSPVPGDLYGRYFEKTGVFNLFPLERQQGGSIIGELLPRDSKPTSSTLCGVITDTGIDFYSNGKRIATEVYSLYKNIFSRNTGILETSIMSQKKAIIVGCGSVGSLVALELTKAGVQHFILVDADILEYHNLSRHQCGIDDVGNLKIDAVKQKILNINPKAQVITFEGIIQNLPKDTLDQFCVVGDTIFVGCADNRGSDVYTNQVSIYYESAFISIGFWERAYAGEIFYHIHGQNMPCYQCALGDGSGLSARAEANHHVYSNQEEVEVLKFEPGLSVDIGFGTSIGIKLILDILNRDNPDYIPRLLDNLTQYTLICNTSNPEIGGDMVEIFSYPLQVTTSLKVGFSKNCTAKCRPQDEE